MKIINRRAKFDYELVETYEAGISLTGAEAKSVKMGHVDISQAHAKEISGEFFLINANISGENVKKPTRLRKLLLHKKEIVSLTTKAKAKRLTFVPLSIYTTRGLVKVKLALAKPKKSFSKKETIKKRDIEREVQRELRGRH